jgi:hypothetical protein
MDCMKDWNGCKMSWKRSENDKNNCVWWFKREEVNENVWIFVCECVCENVNIKLKWKFLEIEKGILMEKNWEWWDEWYFVILKEENFEEGMLRWFYVDELLLY